MHFDTFPVLSNPPKLNSSNPEGVNRLFYNGLHSQKIIIDVCYQGILLLNTLVSFSHLIIILFRNCLTTRK